MCQKRDKYNVNVLRCINNTSSIYTYYTIHLRAHDSLPVTRRGAWQLVVLQGGLLVLVLVDAWSPRCEELRPG